MADREEVSFKRKVFESDSSASERDPYFDSDDSEGDKDYAPTDSDSDFLSENELSTSQDDSQDDTVSRGVLQTPDKATPSRWRKSNIECRKKQKAKTKRNLGYSYESSRGKNVIDRKIGSPCKCKRKCRELLHGREGHIFNTFWDLGTYKEQNMYIFGSIKAIPKKRSYKKKTKRQESSRKVTYQYFVKVDGVDIQLCKQEYLSVHGLQKSSKRVRLICSQIAEGRTVPKSDERGKHHNRANRIPLEQVQSVHDHIKAFPKYVSHYSRKKNPNRIYLNHDISISGLYKDFYLDWCKERNIMPVREDRYRRIFCNEYNIGFKLPKSDTCHTCDSLNILIRNEENNKNEEEVKKLKTQLELHHRKADAMQNNLKEEVKSAKANNNKLVIAFDLQQTLPTPSLTVGPAFYLRKAWTYNLGVHDCVTGKGSMFMWTESTAKRGSEEIASIILKYIFSRTATGQNELVIFTDNCGGQNKNWLIMSLWLQLVREGKFKSVEHRFLVSGHTYLPCDRDFALIEKHKRFLRQVYCPDDWYTAVLKCKRTNPFEVTIMQQEDFFTFKNITVVRKNITDEKEPLNFNRVRCFRFESNNPNAMFVKHELNGLFKKVNVGKRGNKLSAVNNILNTLNRKYDAPLKLNCKKVADLRKLMQFIPPINQSFYLNIFEISGEQSNNIETEEPEDDVECVDGDEILEFEEDD
ncbi:unnamed protein product [Brassicogethes aeneus]|uniref:DUF7869 domain-containing protein n=1 Tax=Brassicogethes aeneus TaxID=1431903 RepID=A0A9P0B843_BRAAE|nr:unnamed protein product [Brassicogethes aeneus]